MGSTVERVGRARLGTRERSHTLEQQFRFKGTTADAITHALLNQPLVGDGSVFGNRPGREEPAAGAGRYLRGFSPAPTFRFDVTIRQVAPNTFVVGFAQPDRPTPYLEGEIVWFLSNDNDDAIFDEQINTPRALEHATKPLSGTRRSLRRWLFFRMGHKRVMDDAVKNIAPWL
jgi:hypothetical protein